MSADNYYTIWNIDNKWYVEMGFLSCDPVALPAPESISFDTLDQAQAFTDRDYATEYGTSVMPGTYSWREIKAMARTQAIRHVDEVYASVIPREGAEDE